MSIRFGCERCGHVIEVADRFSGLHGHCKHCGHSMVVPDDGVSADAAGPPGGLRLRAIDDADAADDSLDAVPSRLAVRPVESASVAPLPSHLQVDDLDANDMDPSKSWWSRRRRGGPSGYVVLDPEGRDRRGGPTPLGGKYASRAARFVASALRLARDWLYVISIGFLAAAGLAFVFQAKWLLHVGAVGVVAANAGMLAISLFYLVVLPFRDGLTRGLACLLLPPYAIYYWATNWPRMKTPVVNTLKSFAPIALIGAAYLVYTESPEVQREVQEVERVLEKEGEALDKLSRPPAPPKREGEDDAAARPESKGDGRPPF
jgi:hypothetical protein